MKRDEYRKCLKKRERCPEEYFIAQTFYSSDDLTEFFILLYSSPNFLGCISILSVYTFNVYHTHDLGVANGILWCLVYSSMTR